MSVLHMDEQASKHISTCGSLSLTRPTLEQLAPLIITTSANMHLAIPMMKAPSPQTPSFLLWSYIHVYLLMSPCTCDTSARHRRLRARHLSRAKAHRTSPSSRSLSTCRSVSAHRCPNQWFPAGLSSPIDYLCRPTIADVDTSEYGTIPIIKVNAEQEAAADDVTER